MKCRILCTAACISLVFLQPWTSLAAQTALPISQDEPLRVLIQLPLFASIKKLYGVNLRQTFTSEAPPAAITTKPPRIYRPDDFNYEYDDYGSSFYPPHETSKRQNPDYGHLRFGKQAEYGDYGHLRFGRAKGGIVRVQSQDKENYELSDTSTHIAHHNMKQRNEIQRSRIQTRKYI